MQAQEPLAIQVYDVDENNEYSTTKLNGEFLHFHLLIDLLRHLKSTLNDREELISLCRTNYQMGVDEFERAYSPNQAIWWYTRESFLYRFVNKSLRTQDIDALYLLRFFFADIYKALKSKQYRSSIRVYRGQLMSLNELDGLKKSIGQLISVNSLFSTSVDRDVVLSFLHPPANNQVQVLFEIDAEPSRQPFSNIAEQSAIPNEEEILFMCCSIFRLNEIQQDEPHRWIIRMSSSSENPFESVFHSMREVHRDFQTNLLVFGKLLWKMGKYSLAEKYIHRLLNQLPSYHYLISYCYRALGNIADDKGEYRTSLEWHLKSLDKIPSHDRTIRAESYNNLGCVYENLLEYEQALVYYEKAMKIWKEIYGENHLNIAACLNNIACVHSARDNQRKALQLYQQVLQIRQEKLPENHAEIGASHNNIGEIYRRLKDYRQALKHFTRAYEIYRLALPKQHPGRGEICMNLGLVYQNLGDSVRALEFYRKALRIYQRTLSSTHPTIENVNQLIANLS